MQRNIKTHTTIAAITLTLCLVGMVMSGTAFAQGCVNNGDGTLTDAKNRIMVREACWPDIWESCMQVTSSLVIAGYSDWRVPSNDDYYALVKSPCLKEYPLNVPVWTWSSTTDPHDDTYAYTIDLKNPGPMPIERKNDTNQCIAIRNF
ncbi:DUF1566 domain-containing protein [Desulfonatronum sp. SC1]|uniref:Lcl domain-containing protein n=1 Tax=Desulfonatronum sp. SC1 TaxID=2109626 RepID=UPI001304FCC6|nr:DUF1566 domain-containing protein [Desulfonatronum sp. SC1]